jgi:hypothetical protein
MQGLHVPYSRQDPEKDAGPPVGQIQQELAAMEVVITSLSEEISALEGVLTPALRSPDPLKADASGEMPRLSVCPIAERLQVQCEMFMGQIEKLAGIRRRVDI